MNPCRFGLMVGNLDQDLLGKCAEWYQWIALIETLQTCSVKLAT
jgi:hypothetical protein